ncbi:MAG: aldo/keto reductase [Candidatus Rokuibacteriota bacterium]|nr:MAG: aldo/keto reductase [Candidatus Rokubacteria bacterium]
MVPTRRLGHSTLEVSAIGLGCMGLSAVYGPADVAESITLVQRAIDLGVNHLDSSDMYGWGHNEELLGRALKGRRDRVVLATKFGQVQNPGGPNQVNGRPEYVVQACDASLQRLGVDVIDLYYQHRVDPKVPIEETVGGMKRCVEQGKVRFLGLSEAAPTTVRRAHRVHPISALQSEYSLLYRKEPEETLPTLRELGISFVAYSPLGRSLLTGQIHKPQDIPEGDRRLAHPRFQGDNLVRNLELVKKIEAFAREKGCTPGQLVLAWLLAQGREVVAIPGTKRLDRLQENLGALKVQLSDDDVKRLAASVPSDAAAGPRYPEAMMKAVYI